MKSIIQNKKECFLCRYLYDAENTNNLNDHHIFFGTANRRLSEEYGLKAWLCIKHHTEGIGAVHKNRDHDLMLKKIAQKKFEETRTRKEFIQIFGKSYID